MTAFRAIFAALLCVLLSVFEPAAAQTPSDASGPDRQVAAAPDYDVWESVASRAETAIDEGTDTNQVLETLRERLTGFRSAFDTARKVNAERIATLRSQIEALGPPPAEGESEAEDIAQRRVQLNRQLTELLAPVQVAEEAFTRADGLIREIDAIIRERQTERLLSLGPSPLNPVLWPQALEEAWMALVGIGGELTRLDDPIYLKQARENLPLVLVLLVMALLLMIRGRVWAAVLGDRLRLMGGRGSGVWSFIVSLLRIALPLAGLYALTEAIYVTGLVGIRTSAILDALPVWGLFLLGFRWLSEQLFSRNDDAIIQMSQGRRSWARFYISAMALLMVMQGAMELFFSLSDASRASEAVILFPLVVMLGFVLYRFGGLLRTHMPQGEAEAGDEETGTGGGVNRILRWAGLLAQIVAIAAPVMSAIGYSAFSSAILYPTILSMALLGFVMTLQRFLSDVYGLVSGQGKAAHDSLLAVLIALVLVISSAPLLALIWGARVADLTELWSAFLRGFKLGETTISPSDFLTFALLFAIGFVLTRLLQAALRTSILPKTRIDIGGQNALTSGTGYIGSSSPRSSRSRRPASISAPSPSSPVHSPSASVSVFRTSCRTSSPASSC